MIWESETSVGISVHRCNVNGTCDTEVCVGRRGLTLVTWRA